MLYNVRMFVVSMTFAFMRLCVPKEKKIYFDLEKYLLARSMRMFLHAINKKPMSYLINVDIYDKIVNELYDSIEGYRDLSLDIVRLLYHDSSKYVLTESPPIYEYKKSGSICPYLFDSMYLRIANEFNLNVRNKGVCVRSTPEIVRIWHSYVSDSMKVSDDINRYVLRVSLFDYSGIAYAHALTEAIVSSVVLNMANMLHDSDVSVNDMWSIIYDQYMRNVFRVLSSTDEPRDHREFMLETHLLNKSA